MMLGSQTILPAIRHMKEFERVLESRYDTIILLESHICQLKSIADLARRHGKKLWLHADLVQGLKNDEHGALFLCQEIKPAGVISTRSQVITTAKKKGLVTVQRLFLLDSGALETSYKILEQTKPDFVEVLPGVMPHIITEIREQIRIPIIVGGFIRTREEIESALAAGAIAVTTSDRNLWKQL
ncbi:MULTISPECIES: glycerol-3-phosphate responsive antiterminator [Brevibacillus]